MKSLVGPGFSGAILPLAAGGGTNGLVFVSGQYDADYWMPVHTHDFLSLVFIRTGMVRHEVRGQSIALLPESLLLLPAREPHSDRFVGPVRALQIAFHGIWSERAEEVLPRIPTLSSHRHSSTAWVARRIHQELNNGDDLTPLLLEGLTLQLLGELSREAGKIGRIGSIGGSGGGRSVRSEPVPTWLNRARDYLHAHFQEGFTLDGIADAVGVHPAHLTRTFRRHFHCTLGDYARKLRVEAACRLLSTTEYPNRPDRIGGGVRKPKSLHPYFPQRHRDDSPPISPGCRLQNTNAVLRQDAMRGLRYA